MVEFFKVITEKGNTEEHDFELPKIKHAIQKGDVYMDEGGTVVVEHENVMYYLTEEDIEELGIDSEKIIDVESIYWPEVDH